MSSDYTDTDILNYLGIQIEELPYSEGNCMFLSKKIIDFLFLDNLHILYNILNRPNSFDVNWVRIRFRKTTVSANILYSDFRNNNEYMNINNNGYAVGNNFDNLSNDMPDGMVEHVFERIYINIINHLNLKYSVSD